MFKKQILSDEAGERLDRFLVKLFPNLSRAALQNHIKEGKVLVNGEPQKAGRKLKEGDLILVLPIDTTPKEQILVPTPLNFPILFEDEHIICVNKPAGISVHPGAGKETETVVSSVLGYTKLSSIGAPLRPGVVHRLDKGTTGALVLAKTDEAHKKLVSAFASRKVEKEYRAIVQGQISEDRGLIEVAIDRDRINRKRMRAVPIGQGKIAISKFEVLERFRTASYVKVNIETGRTHQIRVHFSFINHPLLGDILYGGSRFKGKAEHFLHCYSLRFKHPISSVPLEIIAPIPPKFNDILKELRMLQKE